MEEKDPRGDSCWLGSRKGIRPVKNRGMVEVGTA